MGFVARVRRTLEERRLLAGGRHVVVACSGGPDSSALLEALAEIAPAFDLQLTAASVDHGLRPEAADDVALVEAHAARLGVPFRAMAVHVDPRQGKQAGAREARYGALLALAGELGAARVATGHTQDDQAETVLARLLRNPSVRSLGAIEPAREDGVIRPLIDCRRDQVAVFVQSRGLKVAADPSNDDLAYTRSRVRHDLLPRLLDENPRLIPALAWLAEDAREHQTLVEESAVSLDLDSEGARGRLREHSSPVARCLLGAWIRARTGRAASLRQLRELQRSGTRAGILLSGGWEARWEDDGSLLLDAYSKRTRGR